jgi:hypothetical protein
MPGVAEGVMSTRGIDLIVLMGSSGWDAGVMGGSVGRFAIGIG